MPSSGWQKAPFYLVEDLKPATRSAWRVKGRDGSPAHHETPWSAAAGLTTGDGFPTALAVHLKFDDAEIAHDKTCRDAAGNVKARYSNQARRVAFPWSRFCGGDAVQF